MGRHNKSNGRVADETYDYNRWDPAQGPRPAYGRAKRPPTMTHEEFLDLVYNTPHFRCGALRNFKE